jgi:hypothetical protein
MLYTRMLLSCLVDADYSVSASDKQENYLEESCKQKSSPKMKKLPQNLQEPKRVQQTKPEKAKFSPA